jgi:hypothetical protein
MKLDPHLFFKYNRGLGDFVASTLHSKMFGWLTKLITGKDKPCSICSQRAKALNILFPIPFWRLFFKHTGEMLASFNKDLQEAGFQTVATSDESYRLSVKKEDLPNPLPSQTSAPIFDISNPVFNDEKMSKYVFVSSSEQEVDHLLIRTQFFKLKS